MNRLFPFRPSGAGPVESADVATAAFILVDALHEAAMPDLSADERADLFSALLPAIERKLLG